MISTDAVIMNQQLSEKRIIDGFLDGNREASATIQDWITSVLDLPGWHTSIKIAGDDIKQRVLIILTQNFRENKYQGKGLKTYISRIVKYTCLKVYDRARQTEPLSYDPKSDKPTPEEELIQSERWAVLRKVISKMEYRCRRIFVLRYYKEWNHNKIGDVFGVSPGVSRQWLKRCLDKAKNMAQKLENM